MTATQSIVIVHASDTHFALPEEHLDRRQLQQPLPFGGVLGPALEQMRALVLKDSAAQPAEETHYRRFLEAIKEVAAELAAEAKETSLRAFLIHTGDMTQGGQPESMSRAIVQISEAFSPHESLFQVGNHDVWPSAFPPFAPEHTPRQHAWVRDLGQRLGGRTLPSQYPGVDVLSSPPATLEFVRFNTVLADSLPNAFAYGRLGAEVTDQGIQAPSVDQIATLTSHNRAEARLRIAAAHHPIFLFNNGFWNKIAGAVLAPAPCGLLQAKEAQKVIVDLGFNLVLCGHEHAVPRQVLFADSRVLQLAAGSPSFAKGLGNSSEPHFGLYWLDICPDEVHLQWFTCTIDPLDEPDWVHRQGYVFDSASQVWREAQHRVDPPRPIARMINAAGSRRARFPSRRPGAA